MIAGTVTMGCPGGYAFEPSQGLIVLCYHDIPDVVTLDDFGVDQKSFINTIEYFRAHEYTFVSLDDLITANRTGEPLPQRSIMLTFDDGFRTFYDFVYPLLKEYKIPSTLAIVTSWIDGPVPKDVKHPLMTWEQIKEVSHSPYVEVISHSHDLHKGVIYNPQGNEAAAAVNRRYDSPSMGYENDESYRQRLKEDLKMSKRILEEKTEVKVRAMAWPYGAYNELIMAAADEIGMGISFALRNERSRDTGNLREIERFLIHKNPTLRELLIDLKLLPGVYEQKRIIQVDLDLIYDEDPGKVEGNLSRLLDRVKGMAVSTVYLQAFSDPEGTGNIREVYFPNRVLPMKADLFNRVVHQIRTRALVEVYAWMPMLSITLPDKETHERLRVRENRNGTTQLSTLWYERLTPFSDEAWEFLKDLYEDMAVHSLIDGVVFQDDGYLNDFEDYHPDALAYYKMETGAPLPETEQLTERQREEWTQMKMARLNDLSRALMDIVKKHRPEAKFARTLYAPVLMDPANEEWLAQSYQQGLDLYDYVVIMAYPRMEEVKKPQKWLKELVRRTGGYDKGIEKTVFKIQSYDWKKDLWIDSDVLDNWFRVLVAEGAHHLAYYPDDLFEDHPRAGIIRNMMSKEDFPFKRDWK
jgi:biofilm PGA synthesis lipoprotein PgaB